MKHWIGTVVLLTAIPGCFGAAEENTNNPKGSDEEFFAEDVRSRVDDLEYALESGEGSKVNALKEVFTSYEESPIDLESGAVGDHEETYKAILKGMDELKAMLAGSPSADELQGKVAELKALTDKLPRMNAAGSAG